LSTRPRTIAENELTIDQYSKESVDQFNAALEEHQRLRSHYNDGVSKFNSAVAESNRDVAAFNANCAERQYYIDDMRSILRELGIAAN
jgi:hypothetical protein